MNDIEGELEKTQVLFLMGFEFVQIYILVKKNMFLLLHTLLP